MSEEENFDLIFKLILIGDSGVGKTNILNKYVNNEFSYSTQSTVGVEFGSKIVKKGEKTIKLQIWDTAGQERYKSITSAYYKGSKGALIVYDITKKQTFENVDRWIDELKEKGSDNILIMLIGNKSDLEDKREVQTDEVAKKTRQYKIAFCETSALNGNNIEHAFDSLVEEISKNIEENNKAKENKIKESIPIITLDADEDKEESNSKSKKKKCC